MNHFACSYSSVLCFLLLCYDDDKHDADKCLNFMRVNNAGINGLIVDQDALMAATSQGDFAAKILSDSPRIVNVSSSTASLEKFPSGWGKGVLSDAESLTEEKVEEVLKKFLADFKEGSLETKGWPSCYICLFCLQSLPKCLHKDSCQKEGLESIVRAALLPEGNQSGLFFRRSEIVPF
ncbi:hypothetical protein K1719_019167 [Acacia pycnantha]|nr:hypothetical protein K1719_019167 [Acacia pycnantha]